MRESDNAGKAGSTASSVRGAGVSGSWGTEGVGITGRGDGAGSGVGDAGAEVAASCWATGTAIVSGRDGSPQATSATSSMTAQVVLLIAEPQLPALVALDSSLPFPRQYYQDKVDVAESLAHELGLESPRDLAARNVKNLGYVEASIHDSTKKLSQNTNPQMH